MPVPDVPDDLVFTTGARSAGEERETVPFAVDGTVLTARRPKEAHLLLLSEAASKRVPTADKVHLVFQFLDGCLTDESSRHLRDRLLDPDDALDATDVFAIMERLVSLWVDQGGENRAARRAAKKTTARR
jgi:hypothetical protein